MSRLAGAVAVVAVLGLVTAGASSAGRAVAAYRESGPSVPGVISTVAGGVGGPAQATTVSVQPCGASYAAGRVYVGDTGPNLEGDSVRELNPQTGWLTTPAGTGAGGPLGLGGLATSADWQSFGGACGVAGGPAGNLVIADTLGNLILLAAGSTGTFYGRAMTAGHIYAVAGDGTAGFSGDGGPATSAELNGPLGVAVDGAGNLVIADTSNNRIRVVAASTGTFYGRAMTAGHIYTVAGNGTPGRGGDGRAATKAQLNSPTFVAVSSTGNLVISAIGYGRIRVVAENAGVFYGQSMTAGDIYTVGGTSTYYSIFTPVAVDGAGNLVIATVQYALTDVIQVLAERTGTFYGQAMTAGNTYTVAGTGTAGFSGDGGPATSAELNGPYGVTVDGSGNLVIADQGNGRVRVVAAKTGTFYGQPMTTGDIYTVAGNGRYRFSGAAGPATGAELDQPQGVAVDAAGNTLVADTVNNRILVSAAATGTLYGRSVTTGHIYDEAGNGIAGYAGDGGPATSAEVNIPGGVAADRAGNLVIADSGNYRVRVVAAKTGTFYGQPMTAGNIYTVAGDGTQGFAGDGGPATSAELDYLYGVAVDGAGNLVIADPLGHRVRVVAAKTGTFYGQPMTAGDIYTVAGDGTQGFAGDGGPATSAQLNYPYGVAADGAGNVVITDSGNSRIRVVAASTGTFYGQPMTAGNIYTVAGDGMRGFAGDGGPATSAELSFPQGVAVDGASNLLIADTSNQRIRVVAASTGTFYGQPMTAGNIYTVAGNGTYGFSGDGGPGTSAELCFPGGVAAHGTSGLLIADTGYGNSNTSRIRMVAG